MLPPIASRRSITVWMLTVASILACNLQAPASSGPASIPSATALVPTSAATTATEVPPTASAKATPSATQGPAPVVAVNATGGRLNVRRGPGPDYDTVGAFLDGQSSTATGRNENGKWVLISIPKTSKPLGWITLETKFTTVIGDVAGLSVVEVAPAVPAYIRNCTGREMLINPIGAVLQPRGSAPDNQLQFFPGEYSVVDMETETEIGGVTVFEGKTIDIKQDSSGKNFSC